MRKASSLVFHFFLPQHGICSSSKEMPKGLKRYYGQDHLHFINCSCYHRQPWLATPQRRNLSSQILRTFWKETRQRYGFVVVG
jgi:hypothetical protein